MVEPVFDALAFHEAEVGGGGVGFVFGGPEAGAGAVDLVDDGFVEAAEGDDAGVEAEGVVFFAGLFEDVEVVAAQLVEHDDEVEAGAEAVEELFEEVDGVFAGVHDVPVGDGDAEFAGEFEDTGFVHPFDEGFVGLSGEIDEDAFIGVFVGGLDDGVEAFVAVDDDGGGEVGVEAEEGAVGAVGVEADEGVGVVDEVLGDDTGDDGFADAAFFAADEVDVCHDEVSGGGVFGVALFGGERG